MPLALGLSMLVSAAMGTPPADAAPPVIISANIPQAQTVQQYVKTYFRDIPIMVAIAGCESHFHQYDENGSLYRGVVNNEDVGVMQINRFYHLDTAKAMDLDLTTIEGNVAYARYLYEQEGTAPWLSSSKCWNTDTKVASKTKTTTTSLADNSK